MNNSITNEMSTSKMSKLLEKAGFSVSYRKDFYNKKKTIVLISSRIFNKGYRKYDDITSAYEDLMTA